MIRRTRLLDRSVARRSAALHFVATEDTIGPGAYFAELERIGVSDPARVRVIAIPTEDGRSSPAEVVTRLREYLARLDAVQPFDGRWVLIDVDHHFRGGHQRDLAQALQQARTIGAEVLVSNPCFEVWLLMHVAELGAPLGGAPGVEAALRAARPGWRKNAIATLAIAPGDVARALSAGARVVVDGVMPVDPGSTIGRLVGRVAGG